MCNIICLLTGDFDTAKYPIPPQYIEQQQGECRHTPTPEGYNEFQEFCKRASKTHSQVKCQRCGLWAIWLPKAVARETNKHRLAALNAFLKSQGLETVKKLDY